MTAALATPVRFARRWAWIGYLSPVGQLAALLWGLAHVAARLVRAACRLVADYLREVPFRGTRRLGFWACNVTRHVDRRRKAPVWWSARILGFPFGRQV